MIHVVFATPVFVPPPINLLGLYALGAVGWVVGMLLLRRLWHIDGDAHSFRATNRRDLTTTVTIVGAVGIVALGSLLLVYSAT